MIMTPWPDEHLALLKELVAAGNTASQAAIELNRMFRASYSKNAVMGKIARGKLQLARVWAGGERRAWLRDDVDRLKELLASGIGPAAIGKLMGRTKSQVANKMARLDLHKTRAARVARTTVPVRRPPREARPEPVPAFPNPTRLIDIGAFQCRAFMPGQDDVIGPDKLFCGAPIKPGRQFRFCPACSVALLHPSTAPRRNQFVQHDRSMARVG